MKKLILLISLSIICVVLIWGVKRAKEVEENDEYTENKLEEFTPHTSVERIEENSKKMAFKDKDEEYFKVAGKDHINTSPEVYRETYLKVMSAPCEHNSPELLPFNTWNCIGPYGIAVTGSQNYSGRCTDIGFEGLSAVRVASAQGGLWSFIIAGVIAIPVPKSDEVPSLSIGSFDTDPLDTAKIVIGTGEPRGSGYRNQAGFWKTTNGGTTWTQCAMDFFPYGTYKVRYKQGSSQILYAATQGGFFISTNGGSNWTRSMDGGFIDFDANGSIVYASRWQDGIYKSTNDGANFTKLNSYPVTAANFCDVRISIAQSLPATLYTIAVDNGQHTKGIFKSTDSGVSWQDVSWRDGGGNVVDFHWSQGYWNNTIGVCPTDANLLLVGGGSIVRTANGGANWDELDSLSLNGYYHVDNHRIRWRNNGNEVYVCNDGGFQYSSNAGITWTATGNSIPVTQFYSLDIAVQNGNIVAAGGTQDNGFPMTRNNSVIGGGTWQWNIGRDGGYSVIDENNPNKVLAHTWNFANYFDKTTDGGVTWSWAGNGLNGNMSFGGFRDDRVSPVYVYAAVGQNVFYSENFGDTWNLLGEAGQPFNTNVWRMNVSKWGTTGGTAVYAIQWSNPPSQSNVLRVNDNGTWFDRGAGLPLNPIRYVAQHPRDNYKCYAIEEGNSQTQRIFKTTNRGINWTNVTGNLLSVAGNGIIINDLVAHPTNDDVLFIGTQFGAWNTTNGGTNWQRWNLGMPTGNEIVEMSFIDSLTSNKFYVAAATHGRGVWIREATDLDPLTGIHNDSNLPLSFELSQNYPNPFNPATNIKYALPVESKVSLKIYDMTGREIASLVNSVQTAGYYVVQFNASNMASGMYFYNIIAEGSSQKFITTKKMVLVK
ncbi:hypothetical protein BH10BAC5_BH10BAC5_15620 [soil metagenome]